MTNVQRIQLGPETTPIQQRRAAHGRWRMAYQRAGSIPEGQPPVPAAFYAVQDADRLAFALTEGPAAAYLAERIAAELWTRATIDQDWPQNLRDWLAETARWSDAPAGRTGFICGRLERNIPGGRIYLAWLGMSGVRLEDRQHTPRTLDTAISADEAWTPRHGPEPVGMALHAYRGNLSGLTRLVAFTTSAATLGEELADLSTLDLQQGLDDWSAEAEHDLAFFDLRLNPVVTEPSTAILTYHWTTPDLCVLAWQPAAGASAYRIEEAAAPAFEDPGLLAELTDTRQMQYGFSPPTTGAHYYRLVPLNQGVPGVPSEPVSVTPMLLTPPAIEAIEWSDDGGYRIVWTTIAQATGYELQVSTAPNFEPEESQVIYRGELAEAYLPPDTPPSRYYRVRAINVLYAPHMPSPWSRPRRSPSRLNPPVFTRVMQDRLEWETIPGARQYAIHVTGKDQDEGQGEDVFTSETMCGVADQPATYRVRAFRSSQDLRTASEWSDSVTIYPKEDAPPSRAILPLALPVLAAAALVALIIGIGLGIVGLDAYRAANATATRTPLPRLLIAGSATAAQANVLNATAVVQLGAQSSALQTTVDAQVAFNDAQTAAAAAWTATPTPSATPNLTGTVAAALIDAQTAAAAGWTATPIPSDTPNLTRTVAAALINAQTATAALWTATPTPSATPNLTGTIAAALNAALTATAARWTATPTPSDTPAPTETPLPSDTPDAPATLDVALAQALTATDSARPTATPTPDLGATVNAVVDTALPATLTALPTRTPPPTLPPTRTPGATPDWQATIDALQVANLPAGCYVVDPALAALPVYAGPSEEYVLAALSVARFAQVVARWEHGMPADGASQSWLAVEVAGPEAPSVGWLRLPEGASFGDLVGGSDCQPERDIPALLLSGGEPLPVTATLCQVGPRQEEAAGLYGTPAVNDTLLGSLAAPLVVLERASVEADSFDIWLGVWRDEAGDFAWVREREAQLAPENCSTMLALETIAAR